MKSREINLTNATQTQLVILALYALGGEGMPVDTEDVAVQVQQLAPGRFAWRKYPDQINLELVRVALSDAAKGGARAMVSGTGTSGWSLTALGRSWANANIERVAGTDLARQRQQRTAGSVDQRRWHRERARVMATNAWEQWSVAQEVSDMTRDAAAELFRIDRYVVGRAREMKVNRLREMFSEDLELSPFLEAAAKLLLEEG